MSSKKPRQPLVYPLTKRNRKRVYHTIDSAWVGIGAPGACPAPVRTHSVQDFVVEDSVLLGASPPDWRARLRYGRDASSLLEGTRYFHYVKPGTLQYFRTVQSFPNDNQCQGGYAQGSLGFALGFPPRETAANAVADQKARQKFLDKCLQQRKSWRGGNFLVEVGETIQMLRHPLTGLAEGLRAFIKGVKSLRGYWLRGELEAYARHLGNLWLEYSFGWSPFFEDIKDINYALTRLADGTYADSKRISATGSHSVYSNQSTGQIYAPPGGLPGLACFDSYQKKYYSVRYVAGLKARPENLSGILDNFGISPTDILPAVWEAIPWSFFVDYFLNVQEQLDSMQFGRADFSYMFRGVRNIVGNYRSALYTDSKVAASVRYNVTVGGGAACSSSIYVRRDPQYAPPFPHFHFRIPGLGSLKWVNVGALVAQINGSRP